jgi:RHS repeat-associated protein
MRFIQFALYEAYGTRPYEWGDDPDCQKANTKEEESDLNLLNEGMRFRDLETGVFLTRDPIGYGDGPNVYCYVHCNPITRFDALGLGAVDLQLASSGPGVSSSDDVLWVGVWATPEDSADRFVVTEITLSSSATEGPLATITVLSELDKTPGGHLPSLELVEGKDPSDSAYLAAVTLGGGYGSEDVINAFKDGTLQVDMKSESFSNKPRGFKNGTNNGKQEPKIKEHHPARETKWTGFTDEVTNGSVDIINKDGDQVAVTDMKVSEVSRIKENRNNGTWSMTVESTYTEDKKEEIVEVDGGSS